MGDKNQKSQDKAKKQDAAKKSEAKAAHDLKQAAPVHCIVTLAEDAEDKKG